MPFKFDLYLNHVQGYRSKQQQQHTFINHISCDKPSHFDLEQQEYILNTNLIPTAFLNNGRFNRI